MAAYPTSGLLQADCPPLCRGSDDEVDDKPIESTADTELYKLTLPMDITAAPQVCLLVVHAWCHAICTSAADSMHSPLPLSVSGALHLSSMPHNARCEIHNSMLVCCASNISSGGGICSQRSTYCMAFTSSTAATQAAAILSSVQFSLAVYDNCHGCHAG